MATNGTRSIPEVSARRASISGLKPNACRAVAGRRIPSGTLRHDVLAAATGRDLEVYSTFLRRFSRPVPLLGLLEAQVGNRRRTAAKAKTTGYS